MRKSKTEKADTHSKIVSVAAKRFRERGLDGVGIDDLMKEIGATVGGFYKHFGSRDDLVVEALAEAFRDLDKLEQRSEDLPALLTTFLSEEHCASPGTGCALTALAGEIRHASTAAKGIFTERVKHGLSFYSDHLNGGDAESRRTRAILIFSAALGGMTLARAVLDKALSREIIDTLRANLIALSQKPSRQAVAKKTGQSVKSA